MRRFSRGIRPPGAPTSIRPPSTPSTDGLPSGADHESATTGPKRPRRTPQAPDRERTVREAPPRSRAVARDPSWNLLRGGTGHCWASGRELHVTRCTERLSSTTSACLLRDGRTSNGRLFMEEDVES